MRVTSERRKSVNAKKKHSHTASDDWRLTPSQIRELKSRLKDTRDPTRFVIVSRFSPKFVLYYNVSDDTYAMNDISAAIFEGKHLEEELRRRIQEVAMPEPPRYVNASRRIFSRLGSALTVSGDS